MPKSSVYSWRMPPELKGSLEEAARREGESLASLLDRIAAEWLETHHGEGVDGAAEQARLHVRLMKLVGAVRGDDPRRSRNARRIVRERLSRSRVRAD